MAPSEAGRPTIAEHVETLQARLVAAAHADRRQFERDLHDGVQQDLIALVVNLQLVRRLADDDPAAAGELLDEIRRDVHDALANVRDLATAIYPPLLGPRGLADALRAAASGVVTVEADGLPRYPAEVEATVYFCCLELLRGAATATVRVSGDDEAVRFKVVADRIDGGSGVDRVAALGGRLTVTETGVSAEIPAQPLSAR